MRVSCSTPGGSTCSQKQLNVEELLVFIDPETDKSNEAGEKALAVVSAEKRKGIGMERRVHEYHL